MLQFFPNLYKQLCERDYLELFSTKYKIYKKHNFLSSLKSLLKTIFGELLNL